jgi:hypothetical protein
MTLTPKDIIEFDGRPHFIESIDGDTVNMWCYNNGERQPNITINLKSDKYEIVKVVNEGR